jgi:uncharacterized protein YpmS
MNKKNIKTMSLIALLTLTTLACNLLSNISADQPRVVPTLAAADSQELQDQLATQISEAMSGVPITVELTESQISSLINSEAAKQPDAQLSNAQVLLENNQMVISGDANAQGISGKINITLDASTDANGKPQLTISNAVLGGFPIPASMLETLSTTINQTMQGQGGQGFEIQSLTIADHKLTITGQKK